MYILFVIGYCNVSILAVKGFLPNSISKYEMRDNPQSLKKNAFQTSAEANMNLQRSVFDKTSAYLSR